MRSRKYKTELIMGKYAERNLYENEWVVEKAPRDIWGLVGWWTLSVLSLALLVGTSILSWKMLGLGGLIIIILAACLLLLPLIKAICETVIFTHTEIVLTNRRLICKQGVFHTVSKDVPLLEIQSVYVDVSFWGRIFNVGKMFIKISHGHPIKFKLQDADDFKTTILGQIDQFELDRLANQSNWTAQALLRGSRGYNPYAAYMGNVRVKPKKKKKEEAPKKKDPYAGYGRDPFAGKNKKKR